MEQKKEEIINMINEIEDANIVEYLHEFIRLKLKIEESEEQ